MVQRGRLMTCALPALSHLIPLTEGFRSGDLTVLHNMVSLLPGTVPGTWGVLSKC